MSSSGVQPRVAVFSSTRALDAVMIGQVLHDHGIHSDVVESNGPFSGSLFAPSEVLVHREDEGRARVLIEQEELRHRNARESK